MQEMNEKCNIKVVCRFRPIHSGEKTGNTFIAKFPTEDCVCVGGKVYMFDKVFKPNATQEKVYNEAAQTILKGVLEGYNGTIFAYGRTASGKTHTMEGILGDHLHQGIIPRMVNDIFNYVYSMEENIEFHIKISYFEIYLEKIRDLLDVSKTNLEIGEDNGVPFVRGITERSVSSPEDVMKVIHEGKGNRHIAVTNMNEHSSRSHSVVLITIGQENQRKLCSKLYLVDLAGSENVCKTGAEGSVLVEAKNINRSLSALGNVISALADGNKSHIPYRDSKLTRILQESLGGNSRTTIIICCSPASVNKIQTKSTLDFGKRAKTIKNTVIVNEELPTDELKKRYEKERQKVMRMKGQLIRFQHELRRWRNGETVPHKEQVMVKDIMENSVISITDNIPNANVFTQVSAEPLSDAERVKFQEERSRLYAQLDEKDDVIEKQRNLTRKLKEQMLEQEEFITATRTDYEGIRQEMKRIRQEKKSAKEKVKEVLQSLDELTISYDKKSQEVEHKHRENEKLNEELSQKLSQLNTAQNELQQMKDHSMHQRKKVTEMLTGLFKDLGNIGHILGNNAEDMKIALDTNDKIDEKFAVARLFISKIKLDVKALLTRCHQLETFQSDCNKKIEANEKELAEGRLLISQYEAKMKSLQESVKDIDVKKRILEETVDNFNEECTKFRAAEEMHQRASQEKVKESAQKTKDLSTLRDEIARKEAEIYRLKELNGLYVFSFKKIENGSLSCSSTDSDPDDDTTCSSD